MKYYNQIDSLRFFAVLSVMIGHWIAWDTSNYLVKNLHWGNGVLFFFVLSGFLITEILLKTKDEIQDKKISLSKGIFNFYVRRTLRIFPAYYLLLFLLYYCNYKNTHQIFPYLVSYTTNILQANTNDYIQDFNHFWSLAVEEQFYLIWPLLILLVPSKHLLKFLLSVIAISLISKICYSKLHPENWMASTYLMHNTMYALSIGGILALLKKQNHKLFIYFSNSNYTTALAGIIYLCSFFFIFKAHIFNAFNFLFDDFLFCLFSCVVLARAVGEGFTLFGKFILENKYFSHLGKISYGLYLYHLFAMTVFFDYISPEIQLMVNKKQTAWFVYFVCTWLTAEISYKFIEEPLNYLKKYFTTVTK